MKQVMPSKNESPLLHYAISKLNPEVFSHPAWIRFGRKEEGEVSRIIEDLNSLAQKLSEDNPSDTCQILLIQSAYQIHAGQHKNALKIVQRALALAERTSLAKEMIWATWAACAICFQEANYEQAARYLEYLQAGLSQQNEWILADFVEVVKQALLNPRLVSTAEPSGLFHNPSCDDLLSLTFDWLRQWGGPPPASGENLDELRIQWVETNQQHRGQRLPLLRSIVGSIRSYLSGGIIDPRIPEDLHQLPRFSILPSMIEEHPSHVLSHEFRTALTNNEVSRRTPILTAVVQMLGSFSITIQDMPVRLPASRGLSLLKYLLLHHKQDTPREVLMDIFWPDAEPEAARNNLNVAMHSLRQALRGATNAEVIHFEDGAYGLATHLDLWLDVEEFEQCIKEGLRLEARNQPIAAETQYEIALNLYQGDFLADSVQEDWTVLDRERLQVAYLETLDHLSQTYFSQERYAACIALCQLILTHDPCREDAHFRMMQCCSRLGQGPLALRQYQICVEALRAELEVDPAPETTQLYNRIRRHERV